MRHADAVDFLRPALGPDPGALWADLGAGRGTFTRALADLLSPDARILALDSDAGAVRALGKLATDLPESAARVEPVRGDLRRLDAAPVLEDAALDGALLANVLHFFSAPKRVLARVAVRLRPGGRLVVVEYEGCSSSPWLPHPLPPARLASVCGRAGLAEPRVVGRRESAFRGSLYCAVTETEKG